MPRKFLTVKDVEKLFDSGEKQLNLGSDVAVTDLAFEKARELGLLIISEHGEIAPSAPIRPYLSRVTKPVNKPGDSRNSSDKEMPTFTPLEAAIEKDASSELRARIVNAVLEKFSGTLERDLIERIIDRVMAASGVK